MSVGYKWWEKTVEYKFVIDNHEKMHWIFPLDGNQEQETSDTIFGCNNKFFLIEFKKDENEIDREFSKFDTWKKYKNPKLFPDFNISYCKDCKDKIIEDINKITTNPCCHFLVYAKLENANLKLCYQSYIDFLIGKGNCKDSYDDMMKEGVCLEKFQQYLINFQKLREIKISKGEVSTSSSSFSDVVVLALNEKNGKSYCFSFSEFNNELLKKLNFELEQLEKLHDDLKNKSIETDINFNKINSTLEKIKNTLEEFNDVDSVDSELENQLEKKISDIYNYINYTYPTDNVAVNCICNLNEIGSLLAKLYGKQELKLEMQQKQKKQQNRMGII